MCGSGQQAVNFATGMIGSGMHDVGVAGGGEHMTRVPTGTAGPSKNSHVTGDGFSET
jgi:acetyl-CoA C-acetyltransferase/acetyl-CoA acyltransferase